MNKQCSAVQCSDPENLSNFISKYMSPLVDSNFIAGNHYARCSKKGCGLLDIDMKMEYDIFYKKDYNEHSIFISDHIEVSEPKRRCKGKTDARSERKSTFTYYIKIIGQLEEQHDNL
uniref:Uncharacterized protein n=1 Tax=Timema cristinae TaxID=61476 RepID=A0A7R9GTH4_TIMCR|nr:unnamed protein product [Timema cristinae]